MSEKNSKIPEPVGLLPYAEIKKRLALPIPSNLISQKQVGRNAKDKVDYVNVTDMKDLMDERCGANHWECHRVSEMIVGDRYVLWLKVVINCDDGAYAQDGNGEESVKVSGFGDSASNAYAQAFRRACESHGLARELWRRELTALQLSMIDEQRGAKSEQTQNLASKEVIAQLHAQAKRIGRTESAVASHYTNKRADLFGDMYQREAVDALNKLKTMKAAEQQTNVADINQKRTA